MDGKTTACNTCIHIRRADDNARGYIGGVIIKGRCRAEINLDALEHNYFYFLKKCGNIIAVVKADAYGHGAVEISKKLVRLGCKSFAVSCVGEGAELRENGISGEITVLGYIDDYLAAARYGLTAVVYNKESAKGAKANGLNAYIKIDTGMRRLGFIPSDNYIGVLQGLKIAGVFTHLAAADSLRANNIEYTEKQLELFKKEACRIEDAAGAPLKKIAANTAAAISGKGIYNGARIGIGLYGAQPSDEVYDNNLLPVMSVKTVIASVKSVDSGDYVSYGRTFRTHKNQKLAVVAMGYADGYPRSLSNCGRMIVNGKYAKVCGRVTMDQTVIDVSGIDCGAGDEVIVLGGDITAGKIADLAGTIPYEILTGISKRVERIYKDVKI